MAKKLLPDISASTPPEKRLRGAVFFVFWLFSAMPVLPAQAQQDGPFDVDSQGWMSLDHYDDKRSRFSEPAGSSGPPSPAPPFTEDEKADHVKAGPPQQAASAPEEPKTESKQEETQPVRSLHFPVMPGLNKGYDLQISSTNEEAPEQEDEEAFAKPTRDLNLPVMPGLAREAPTRETGEPENDAASVNPGEMDDYMWQDAKKAAREKFMGQNGKKTKPIAIRFAVLPSGKAEGAVKPSAPVAEKKMAEPRKPDKNMAVLAQQQKACAALTAYRQRQLEAIESDRQTLNALQAAIAELGLNEKLDFMRGVSPGLAPPAGSGETAREVKEDAATDKTAPPGEKKTEFLQR